MRIVIIFVASVFFLSCNQIPSKSDFVKNSMELAAHQLGAAVANIPDTLKNFGPVSLLEDGRVKYMTDVLDWRVGFFPGSLWYMYDYTKDDQWRNLAEQFTSKIEDAKYNTVHHDVGFMIECSFGNGYRLTKNEHYKDVMIDAARSLSSRFDPRIGCIRSWGNPSPDREWDYLVIIDNMINLELLFNATELTGDSMFYKIAVSHADVTMKNHYRPDYSCYHVVDYDSTGVVKNRRTAQGYADESSWSRGQAWGLYGFIMCFRETGDKRYLEQAEKIANWWLSQKTMPEDGVPYWDFDAPMIPNEPRDASAAAIAASAFIELSTFETDKSDEYMVAAEKILTSLSSSDYLSVPDGNGYFVLKHSVTSFPGKIEIDVPLNYADYYFLEALMRYQSILHNNHS